MKILLSTVCLLASSPAWAQEVALRLGSPPPAQQEEDPNKVGLTLVQRFSSPGGKLGGDGGDYGDFLNSGYGIGVEVDYLILEGNTGWSWGPYLSIGFDVFGGKEERIGTLELDADNSTMFGTLMGIKGAYQLDRRLFLEGRLGEKATHRGRRCRNAFSEIGHASIPSSRIRHIRSGGGRRRYCIFISAKPQSAGKAGGAPPSSREDPLVRAPLT